MIHNIAVVLEDEAIDMISGCLKRFTKCHRDKANVVRRFQNMSDFPSGETIEHSVKKLG